MTTEGLGRLGRRTLLGAALITSLATVTGTAALGETYPARPITIIVNFPPGSGALSLIVRTLADQASQELRQPVVVEYRTGAGGNIGAQFVAASRPDGYTLLATVDTTLTVNPAIYSKMPFEPNNAFKPITTLATFSQMLVVNRAVLPVASFAELVAHAKQQSVQYASAGHGSPGHIAAELLASVTGIKLQHIPYRGNAPATQALLAGDVPLGFLVSSGVLPLVESGKLTALAISSGQRSPAVPQVPTVTEAGYPGFDVAFGWVLAAPAGTPEPIVERWNTLAKTTLAREDVRNQLRAWDATPVASSPADATERLRNERARWAEALKRAGIHIE